MTAEQWDQQWHRIREDALADGMDEDHAAQEADQDTVEQFGPRPEAPDVA